MSETWTVIGFWHDDEPLAAGAIRGEHPVDGDLDYEDHQPWATSVEADSADEAMAAAVEKMSEDDADGDGFIAYGEPAHGTSRIALPSEPGTYIDSLADHQAQIIDSILRGEQP